MTRQLVYFVCLRGRLGTLISIKIWKFELWQKATSKRKKLFSFIYVCIHILVTNGNSNNNNNHIINTCYSNHFKLKRQTRSKTSRCFMNTKIYTITLLGLSYVLHRHTHNAYWLTMDLIYTEYPKRHRIYCLSFATFVRSLFIT